MKQYVVVAVLMLTGFLALFLLVELLSIPLLTDPSPWLEQGGAVAALVGVGLLVADVVLPVPSSLVMLMHGALFGVVVGTALSLVGSGGAAAVGFAIGRRGGRTLSNVMSDGDRRRADRLLTRYGLLAIVVTRPVPLLAETVVILAGASPLGWRQAMLAALLGSLPGALLYAVTGAFAASFGSSALVFGLVLVVAGLLWLLGRWVEVHRPNGATHDGTRNPLYHAERANE